MVQTETPETAPIQCPCEEVARLRLANEVLRAQLAEARGRLEEQDKRIEELERASARQAAPFRVPDEQRKKDKKKPGRKKGHKASWRRVPDHVDQTITVGLDACPHCGGAVHDVKPVEQYIEDIPPVRVHVTRLVTHTGRCRRCGEVRSRHPMQVSLSDGCAKVQLGPRVLAFVADLKHTAGLSFRKICGVLSEMFGLTVSPGGLSHALARLADRVRPTYDLLCQEIRAGPVVHADETGWWVGGPGWWLWVFARPDITVYRVEHSRGSIVVKQMLGDDFGGVLVSDCLSSYDPIDCVKHKCYAHHLRALEAAIERFEPDHCGPLCTLRVLLRALLLLAKVRDEMPRELYDDRTARIRAGVYRIIDATYSQPGVEKALHRFRTHREHLFTFLDHPDVPPDNNLAERRLRPAVITRKLSCGNRTERGKSTWEVLASTIATCRQRGLSVIQVLARAVPLTAPPPTLDGTPG